MSEDIGGHVTLDTYLVFDKAKVTNENSRLTNNSPSINNVSQN